MSVIGFYGRKDSIVSPKQGEVLSKGVDKQTVHCFEQPGHFPMPDETECFHQAALDFQTDSE